jgi:hypothetical protein
MSKGTTPPRPKLSFEQANAVCWGLLPIGNALFDIMNRLREAGFAAWLPFHEFFESFVENPEELEVHRNCVAELAKDSLARLRSFRVNEEQRGRLYFSPFIQNLRDERDKMNGVSDNELSSIYSWEEVAWRREIDPSQRRRVLASFNDKKMYDTLWNAASEMHRSRFKGEVTRHASGLSRAYAFDEEGRYAFLSAVMEREAAPFGFKVGKLRSRVNSPVFWKQVTEHWGFLWIFEDPDNIFFFNLFEGRFRPTLKIGNVALRHSENAESGELLTIRYQGIIPGFYNAYLTYLNLDELETIIKAHLCLYGLMAPILEKALKTAFCGESS